MIDYMTINIEHLSRYTIHSERIDNKNYLIHFDFEEEFFCRYLNVTFSPELNIDINS